MNTARDNILDLVDQLPQKQQEQVASDLIRNISKENGNLEKLNVCNAVGKKTSIKINCKEEKKVLFETEHLDNFMANTGTSVRQMRKVTSFIRSRSGRKSIPSNYESHITEKLNTLDNIYKSSRMEFDIESSNLKETRPIVWANASDLLDTILEARNVIGNYTIKVMADGGQGFFKICFSILQENDLISANNEKEDYENENLCEPFEKKKKKLYYESGSINQKAKLTSVKRLIMLCIVPNIKESYENIALLFDLTKLNEISFKFVADFKLILIVNGQQTATSMYSCPYCFISLHDLRESDQNGSNSQATEKTIKLKTYGDIRKDYGNFCSAGKNKKKSKEFHSCINMPLFNEEDDMYVIEKCPIPELHVLQGFVNHVFWDGLVPLLGKDKALLWPKKLNLIAKNYHGEVFEGNACRVLLKNADGLNDPEICENVGKLCLVPFISTLKSMDKVVNCCFSTKQVGVDLEKYIRELNRNFEATNLSKTLKLHVTLDHLQDCLKYLNNNGLGTWSEQAGESIHREFLMHWKRRKVNSINDSNYIVKLKQSVVAFSSMNI